jgi:hypothetical protein
MEFDESQTPFLFRGMDIVPTVQLHTLRRMPCSAGYVWKGADVGDKKILRVEVWHQ